MSYLIKAEKRLAYAKVGIYGDAGSGKTLTAAKIAIGLHQANDLKKPIAMFDTEPAASYIIPLFEEAGIEFLVYDKSRALKDLQGFVNEAEQACSVVIVDSITHVWRDAQDSYIAKLNQNRKKKIYQLEFHHWKPIKAAWQGFTDRFLASHLHFIVCGRAGSIYEYQKNEETGRNELITTGSKMAVEKELGYEPSLLIEMVKHRENGRIINRALIEKDRTDKINGAEFDFPTFNSFKPHFDYLNIGGLAPNDTSLANSMDIYDVDTNGWDKEKHQKEIVLEEIKGLFVVAGIDGTGADAKKQRYALLEQVFNTHSWTAISDMHSERLRICHNVLKESLTKGE